MAVLRLVAERDRKPWVWYRRLDRRNGYLAFGPVGTPFNRKRPLHWLVAIVSLWRNGRR
jgi:hypothetical protein